MFGHQSDDQNDANNGQATAATDNALGSTPADNVTNDSGASVDSQSFKPTPASTDSDQPADDASDDSVALGSASPEPDTETKPAPSTDNLTRGDNAGGNDDLLDIKKQALGELSPLVEHLEQSPEEKFKTTMMMIQANDNQSLIPDAYHAANDIKDDKARAQALLDIVNEINYFTHKS